MSWADPTDPPVTFRDFRPEDCVDISRTLSAELLRLGLTEDPSSIAEGEALAGAGPAWTATARDGAVLTCAGFAADRYGQATAWAMLAPRLGPAHLAITRFARWQIEHAGFWRIEALVAARRPEMAWARMIGLTAQADLGRWGPQRERTFLYTRIAE